MIMRLKTAAIAVLTALPVLFDSISASSAPQDRVPVSVEFSRLGNDLSVVYKFAHSVAKFSFAYTAVADPHADHPQCAAQ